MAIPTSTDYKVQQFISLKRTSYGTRQILPGLLPSGPAEVIVLNAPFTTPALPTPCTARPPTTMLEVVAEPAIIDPRKKTEKNVMYVVW